MNNKIKALFDKHINVMHERCAMDGSSYLDFDFDRSRNSYFTKPANPKYLYLDNIPFDSEKELEKYLMAFWEGQPGLQKMVPELVHLAFILKAEQKEQAAELSPFVYAMF